MKSLRNLTLAIALVAGTFTAANAQMKIGAQAMLGMPMGDFGLAAGFGIGGGVMGHYNITDEITLGLDVGYISYGAKDEIPGFDYSVSMIPILVSGNYFFSDNDFRPYAGLGLGITMITVKQSIDFFGIKQELKISDSEFTIAPRVGMLYGLSDALDLSANVGYNVVGDFSYLAINVGVAFTLID